jgi:hypothetical protein
LEYAGRGGGIRTPDPLLPKQMRYQTALRPDHFLNCNAHSDVLNGVCSKSTRLGPQKPREQPNDEHNGDGKNQREQHANQQQEAPVAPVMAPWLAQVAQQ